MTYAIAFCIEAVFFIFTATLFGSLYFAEKSGAPFFPTPKSAIRDAMRATALTPSETFYDLGAGTGKVLIIAEKEFGAHAIGFEISIIFCCIAKINILFHLSHARLFAKNLFGQNLSNADVVFCFLFPPIMQKIENKLKAELKPGARVIVYAFPLPTMTPKKITTVRGKWKMFFYTMQ